MTERLNYTTEYEAMSPIERNGEFRRLYLSMPPHLYRDYTQNFFELEAQGMISDETLGELNKSLLNQQKLRKDSPFRKIILDRIGILVALAPITQIGREHILDMMEHNFELGIMKEHPFEYRSEEEGEPRPKRIEHWLLDMENEKSPGIFGEEKAKDIEGLLYKDFVKTYMYQDMDESESNGVILPKMGDKLRKWRQAFMDRYKDEP